MLGVWETEDRFFRGRRYHFDTPKGDTLLVELLDRAHERLTAYGAHLVLVTMPPRATPTGRAATAGLGDGAVHLNDVYRRYVADHPGSVSLLDLAEIVCHGANPCPQTTDGLTLRPDGLHFSWDVGTFLAGDRVLDRVTAR